MVTQMEQTCCVWWAKVEGGRSTSVSRIYGMDGPTKKIDKHRKYNNANIYEVDYKYTMIY